KARNSSTHVIQLYCISCGSLSAHPLIGDEVTGEDLNHILSRAHHGCDVEAHVNSAENEAFLPDLISGQANRNYRPDNGNGLDQAPGNATPTGPDDSAPQGTHRLQ